MKSNQTIEITDQDLAGLRRAPIEQRPSMLIDLGKRIAQGASDEAIAPQMAELACEDSQRSDIRDAWMSYAFASRSPAFISILRQWMESTDEEIRLRALSSLAWNRSAQVNGILIQLLSTDPSRRVRRDALRSIVRRGTLGEWTPIDLLPLVTKSDWWPAIEREYLRLMRRQE